MRGARPPGQGRRPVRRVVVRSGGGAYERRRSQHWAVRVPGAVVGGAREDVASTGRSACQALWSAARAKTNMPRRPRACGVMAIVAAGRASQTPGGSPRALPVRPRACRWPGSRPHGAHLPIPREPAGAPAAAPCPGRPECMQVEHSTQHELDTTLTRAPARLRGRPRRARRTRSGPRGSADRLQPGAPPSAPGAPRRGGRVSAPHARDRNSTARRHGGQPGAGPVLDLDEPLR
jgi:hypothetical protein